MTEMLLEAKKTKAVISRAMTLISRQVGRAICDYNMLQHGDKVIVAISRPEGRVLWDLLKYRQRFAPIDFELLAVSADLGQGPSALFALAEQKGFNKVAASYNLDDIAETILLNFLLGAEVQTILPKQKISKGRLTLICPLAYVKGQEIEALAKKRGTMDAGGQEVPKERQPKQLLAAKWLNELEKVHPQVKKNILRSLQNVKEDYLL